MYALPDLKACNMGHEWASAYLVLPETMRRNHDVRCRLGFGAVMMQVEVKSSHL